MTPSSHWLVICHHPQDTFVEVVVTDHPDGPRGHVPAGEDADAWLCDEVFGFAWEAGTDLEIRGLGDDWHPQVWENVTNQG